MKYSLKSIRPLFPRMGLVEQSQVVASTAVVVAMVTIVTVHFVTGSTFNSLDFISILTVGVIGFVSVYFSLKYGRMLEEQRRELLELNTIAEAVNHSVELDYVLQSALAKVMELMRAECGWIYLYENDTLILQHRNGTTAEFFPSPYTLSDESLPWISQPSVLRTDEQRVANETSPEFKTEGLEIM